jgi:uncharacterized protein YqfA (UPF0365 family)
MKTLYKLLIISLLTIFINSCEKHSTYDFNQKNQDSIENVNQNNENQINYDETAEEGPGFWKIVMVLLITIGVGAGIFYFFYAFIPIRLWYEAWLSGVHVAWITLLKMRFQRIPQEKILKLLIKAKNAGIVISAKELGSHYLANVDIDVIINSIVRAHNANLTLDLNELAALFLAQVNIEKVLHSLIMAKNADVDTTIQELAGYYLANVDVEKIIKGKITARNSGFRIELVDLKEHYLSGGDIDKTVEAFVAAKKAGIPDFEFKDIAAIDLANYNVMKAIESAITPIVVETNGVMGVCRDGVEITMKVKVTLRAFIKNIIGGVSAETVLARVNEGLATEIGMSSSHYDVLQSPFILADKVQQKGLNERSSFEIISIDVSEIKVGKDISSELRIERAHADGEQAKAELIMAEEKVKKAMAAAFLDGKLSIKEYHRMMNTEADTEMRKKFGESAVKENEEKNLHNKHNNKKEDNNKKDEHH